MRVAVIGDSHAAGLSVSLPATLNAAGHSVALFEHHGGWTTKRLLDEGVFDRALAANPDVVVVVSGHNDPVGTMSSTARAQALEKLRRAGVPFRWLVLPAEREAVEAQIAAARSQLRAMASSSLLDGRDIVDPRDTRDGVHYSAAGYVQIGQFVTKRLKSTALWLWSLGGMAAGFALVWYFRRYR